MKYSNVENLIVYVDQFLCQLLWEDFGKFLVIFEVKVKKGFTVEEKL